ncbi:MAG: alpha/beta fold hydrolase, partial [Candidatus Latescibacterota bacterium]|jgi:pimeloyl-ACP methyl ester carboxylesterase
VREQALDLAIRGGRSCASNLRSKGIDPAGYNTVESADDIDDLRRALGAEKFHLWGISYGTHLAFAVLKRHPGGVGRCVLGGAEGPDHTFKLPSIVQSQLERIGGLCSGHPAWNGVLPDLVSTVRGVLDGLEQIPVTIEVPDPRTGRSTRVGLGRFDVEYATAVGMADTRLLSLLPAWYAGMEKGDFTLPEREPVLAKYMALVKRGVGFNAMGVLMDCASGATAQRWERIEREAPRCALGRTIDFPFPEIGEAWGRPDLGDDYRALVHADNAVLFFSGSLDCRTPLENILEVQKGLPNSGTIVVDGAGHMDVFLSCPDTAGVMTRFLSGEDVDLRKRPAIRPFALADPLP